MSFWNRNIIRQSWWPQIISQAISLRENRIFHSSMHSLTEPYIFYCVSYSIFATSFWPVLMIAFGLHFIRVYFLYWNCANYALNCCTRCYFNFYCHWVYFNWFDVLTLAIIWNCTYVFYGKKNVAQSIEKTLTKYIFSASNQGCMYF